MFEVFYTAKFKKDIKLLKKRNYDLNRFYKVVDLLIIGEPLPPRYLDHQLSGNYAGYRECHIEPDWLLVYKIDNDTLTLILSRTGTHSDLF